MKKISQIQDYIDTLRPVLFLDGWDIHVRINKDKNDSVAEAICRERYRVIYLDIFPRYFTDFSEDKSRKKVILHELCHAITSIQNGLVDALMKNSVVTEAEMRECYERETSWIENIIWKLL